MKKLILSSILSIVPLTAFAFPNMKCFEHKNLELENGKNSYISCKLIEFSKCRQEKQDFIMGYDKTTNMKILITLPEEQSDSKCFIFNIDKLNINEWSNSTLTSIIDGQLVGYYSFKNFGRIIIDFDDMVGFFQTFENSSQEKEI